MVLEVGYTYTWNGKYSCFRTMKSWCSGRFTSFSQKFYRDAGGRCGGETLSITSPSQSS